MGRAPCCSKLGLNRGPWSANEDKLLINYVQLHGEGHWRDLPERAGLLRCGKSCRLRWMNYLRPDIKRGNIASDEEDLIIRLHSLLGNRWSLIAKRLPGRTDNEIKNYWNSHLSKRLKVTESTSDEPKIKRVNADEDSTTKTKIYLPKATRVAASPYKSITTRPSISLSSSHGEATIVINASDVSSLDFVVPEENNLSDYIFEEHQQLLINSDNMEDQVQLNSFADSLLI